MSSRNRIAHGLLDAPFALASLKALRFVMHGADSESVMATRVAPLLCGLVKSYLAGDAKAETKLRTNFIAPTERFFNDAGLWVPHDRVKAFLRKWYIDKRYRGTERYIMAAKAMRAMAKSDRLPTRSEFNTLFGIEHWQYRDDDPENEFIRKRELEAMLQDSDDTSSWSLEDILEVGGGCVVGRNEFTSYCENHGIYEVLTTEFIDALANECSALLQRLSMPKDALCLEVGAGKGDLSHYLRQRGGLNIIATDSGAWRIPPMYRLERLDAEAAIQKYKPTIVICSWMPFGVDLTKAFRAESSVQAYILLGEVDGGACGHPWLTWGVPTEKDDAASPSPRVATAPHQAEGFVRTDLSRVSRHQLSLYDSENFVGNSSAVLFMRQ